MFNLQGSELVIILLLALVVLGPEKLPDAMRKAGQFYGELKKMSSGFQSEFKAAVEEPLNELKDTANTLRDSADFTKLQNGERAEKPKSADMVAAPDPDAVPVDDLPFTPAAAAAAAIVESEPVESGLVESDPVVTDAADSTPLAPFSSSQQSSTTPQSPPAADPASAETDDGAPPSSTSEPGKTADTAAPEAVPGFSIPEASAWSQHFSSPESPESDDPRGDDPGREPADADAEAEAGESSE